MYLVIKYLNMLRHFQTIPKFIYEILVLSATSEYGHWNRA